MTRKNNEKTKNIVRKAYGQIAQKKTGCGCGCSSCGPDAKKFARSIGYSNKELAAIPEEANLALSCGNPIAQAGLKKGETVLDLGSGAGFDCFLAAAQVGPKGKVIGVDMTPEMIDKARANAGKNKIKNVEFRLSEIENLPLPDNSVDVVISNCVINLSTDKSRVFKEIYRVLKPGGRIEISDIALVRELPEKVRKSVEAYVGCVNGAILAGQYRKLVAASGLKGVRVMIKGASSCVDPETKDPIGRAIMNSLGKGRSLIDYVVSVYVEGHK